MHKYRDDNFCDHRRSEKYVVKRVSNGLIGEFDLTNACPGQIGEGSMFHTAEAGCERSHSVVAESMTRGQWGWKERAREDEGKPRRERKVGVKPCEPNPVKDCGFSLTSQEKAGESFREEPWIYVSKRSRWLEHGW